MKTFLLCAGALLSALAAKAQCETVSTLNEDFSTFTTGTTALPQNCWDKIAPGYPGGLVYLDGTDNKYAVYYGAGGTGAQSYLIGPEVNTFDGEHQLAFTTWKLAQGGSIPAGTVTITVGTISNTTDASTFVAVGEPITISDEESHTFEGIVIPSAAEGSHIAWKFSTTNEHNAIAIDDVSWSTAPAPACQAVASINEDFTDFTSSVTLPFNCWSSIANGPMIYTGSAGGSITFYASTSANVAAYLVSPEVSTFDGNHQLTFDARKSTGGTVTLQTGYLTDAADANTFVAVGDLTTLNSDFTTYTVTYPELTGNAHIAFQYTGASVHQAALTDNVIWDEIPAEECPVLETFTEDFAAFTTTTTFPYNCWDSIAANSPSGPMVYVASEGSVTYYAGSNNTTPAYIISPEVSTIDGVHKLDFTATLVGGSTIATLQPGYITNAADDGTFIAVGDAITLTAANSTFSNIVFPAITGNAHIAFRFTSVAPHQAVALDDVSWQPVAAGTEGFTKNNFALYPNPANGNVNVITNGNAGTISIYSITGNKVIETAVNAKSQNINISNLSSGVYVVRYTSGTVTNTQKLIVR